MNYELAKELKEAGFLPTSSYTCEHNRISGNHLYGSCTNHKSEEEFLPYPTLSELIEACGEDFAGLRKYEGKWQSWPSQENWVKMARQDFPAMRGFSTPEEAVARLWLALNKK